MTDIARLGLAVDSSQVENGTVSLRQLTGAAGQASTAARQLAGASQVEAAGQKAATAAVQAHNAALTAQNAVIRSSIHQRTNMIYQLNDVVVSLASGMNPGIVVLQQGSQILQGGFMPALRAMRDILGTVISKFSGLLAVVGAAAVLLQGLTNQINAVNGSNVTLMDTTTAVFESIASGVSTILMPAYEWFVSEWNKAVDQIFRDTAREVNLIIGAFTGAVEAIKAVWGQLPDAIGYVAFEMSRTVANAMVKMQLDVMEGMNNLIGQINTAVRSIGGKNILPTFDLYSFAQQNYKLGENPYASAGDAVGNAGAAFNAAMGKDYVGDWMVGIGKRAQEIANTRGEVDGLGGAAKAANDNLKLLDQGLGDITHWTEAFGSAAKSAFSNLGTGIVEAFRKGGDVAGNVLSMLMDKVGQFGETLLNNGLNGLLNMGLNALGGLFGGGTWGVAGGFAGRPGIFGIPGMAEGGTVGRSGLSWVGEKGPELLRLPQGAQVIPNAPSMAMAANQNGGDIVIHNQINVPAGTSADVAPAIAREVAKELRRQLPEAMDRRDRNPYRRAS